MESSFADGEAEVVGQDERKRLMCEVESLLSDAPLRIRVDGLESRRSYAET